MSTRDTVESDQQKTHYVTNINDQEEQLSYFVDVFWVSNRVTKPEQAVGPSKRFTVVLYIVSWRSAINKVLLKDCYFKSKKVDELGSKELGLFIRFNFVSEK